MPAFSVIVPVYNAEKNLHRCLESLRHQRFSNFEVLMIENGSADKSNAICREYATRDNRFVLHTLSQNCGPSIARNTGLEYAKGQWIAFVDSDDYVTPDYLQQLQAAFLENDADVVFFGYRKVTTEEKELAHCIPQVADAASSYDILTDLARQDLFGYTWIKAFHANAIGDTRFPEKLNLLEDEVFACEVLSKGGRVAVLPEPLYYYVIGNSGSLMGRTHQDYCIKLDAAYCGWKKLLYGQPNMATFLQEKANACVSKCMYYGFEREIDTDEFFSRLAQCAFFRDADLNTGFYRSVKTGKLRRLRQMRHGYQLKITISKLLRK